MDREERIGIFTLQALGFKAKNVSDLISQLAHYQQGLTKCQEGNTVVKYKKNLEFGNKERTEDSRVKIKKINT
jgi:hypothetical protein